MVPLSTLISRIRVRAEAEAGGSSTRFTDEDIQLFINEGLETLAEEAKFYERYVTLVLSEGRSYIDIRGFTNETVVQIKSVWSTQRSDWLAPADVSELGQQWEDASGTPTHFFTRGIYWLGIYPKPQDDSEGFLRVYYAGIPSRFTHPQAVLADLPNHHVPALEDYVLYEMAALDRQTKTALLNWKRYSKREKDFGDSVDRRLVGHRAGRLGGLSR